MSSRRLDVLTLIEAAYRPVESDGVWLHDVASASRPLIDHGMGVVAYFFDRARTGSDVVFGTQSIGADPRFAELLAPSYVNLPPALRGKLLWGAPAASTGSEIIPPHMLAGVVGPFGCEDAIGITVSDASGRGCILNALLPKQRRLDASTKLRWGRVTAHLSAGLRLNRSLIELAEDTRTEAIIEPNGKVQHALGAARGTDARAKLRRAVSRMERARGPLRRRNNDEALQLWPALVDGRWSLVDRFEANGKRYLVAMKNDIGMPDPRSLAPRERIVASYVALGRSNKLIAYELGIAMGTVATLVARVARKLRTRSRAELVGVLNAWIDSASVTVADLAIGEETLTVASRPIAFAAELSPQESAVARAVVEGLSTAAIASRLGRAPATVAHTLERVFRKLEVRSRAELARRFGGAPR